MRKIIVAGNWKMNKDAGETAEFCRALRDGLAEHREAGVLPLVAPVYPFLAQAVEILKGSPAAIAAQDVSPHASGAYTGEVSAAQLASLGLTHCIVGHSERRQYHGETDMLIRDKMTLLRQHGIVPIVCVGETLAQREEGETHTVVLNQLNGCFDGLELAGGPEPVIAYEPVWAIGTGVTATSRQAQEVHLLIRAWLRKRFGIEAAERVPVLYGGSVKPDNFAELLSQPDIDGGLIGGASLKIADFLNLLDTAVGICRNR